ncbi:hypothetical protein, partial [Tritonibacter sp. SIMBA_163]|uniref:hypothetical protein n=1 Tax=Tritonibacter sp. SIMBA_163 TaxID=3080868 RepID=UPI00397F2A03
MSTRIRLSMTALFVIILLCVWLSGSPAFGQATPPGTGDLPDTVTWPGDIPPRGDTYMMSLFSHDIVAHKRLEIEAI